MTGNLTYEPKEILFDNQDQHMTIFVVSDSSVVQWYIAPNSFLTIESSTGSTQVALNVGVDVRNTGANWIHTTIDIRAYYIFNEDYYTEINIPVKITGGKIAPIWQDEMFVFPQNYYNNVSYQIKAEDGTVVYAGKATKYPDDDSVKININKIVKDYLSSSFNEFKKNNVLFDLNDYAKKFDIYVGEDIVGTYYFYNSWGYNKFNTPVLSEPIRNELDNRQHFLCSLYNDSFTARELKYTINSDSGSKNKQFNIYNNSQMLICDNLKTYSNPTTINVANKINYKVSKTCYDWCLYYTNAYGGWDSLLIHGNVKKIDNINSSYYSKPFNNTTLDFEKVKYHNTITTTYRLFTDWFTDEEQSKLYHLLESTEVYLHNLADDVIMPVVITNNKCEYKTFTNNGKKKFYNEINVECSQTKIRL